MIAGDGSSRTALRSVTLLYLHGFRSSPASLKAQQLVDAIAALPEDRRPALHVPMLEIAPTDAIEQAMRWIESHVASPSTQLTIVGSSLGGFYATCLAERWGSRAVLINPAVRPFDDLRSHVGVQVNMYTGDAFTVTETHLAQLRRLAVARITRPARYWLMVQTGDEVLDYREAIAFYRGAFQLVQGGGDHAFQRFAEQIPPLLRFAAPRPPTAPADA